MISQGSASAHAVQGELAAESLRLSGSLRMQVTGWSMLPTIWPGDTLMVTAAGPSEIASGEVGLFRREGSFFVHRVLEKSGDGGQILSRGDANPAPDPPFDSGQLLGKVQFILRGGKRIKPSRRLKGAQRVLAGLLQVSENAARIAVTAHQWYRKSPASR
ncbi:MAG TPA: S24 family peptidase [Candidatus Sulfotelmatobacter sp.]|nr:S24 family peptidase [Candidatus Sulfotelmatobacter sp.]